MAVNIIMPIFGHATQLLDRKQNEYNALENTFVSIALIPNTDT